ncbi:zeta-crystallin-like isoform X2 [Gigantopelta aegis]|uniref:zeta-crystallin-like isoform X2 n=1 Tax=Gigantopelta aegis TaxID=1735272 RepID=UPI001B88DF84|nr:zeta-crystallin-like isoform X2 [Gigantopelta aegis]
MALIRSGITMKAIRVSKFGGPEVLQYEENVDVPKPKNTEVLVKVMAVGVNPVETFIRAGQYDTELPFTPGTDAAGIVENVGSSVKRFKKGDRVLTVRSRSGAYAEYTAVDEKFVCQLHERLSFDQGAAMGIPFYTAYKCLMFRADAKEGETVLIHGASGGVGTACIQIAKAHGMRVFGTAGSGAGLELVKKLGADAVFNHKEKGYTDKIMAATEGDGVDVIVEMMASTNLQKDLEMINYHGRIVNVGGKGQVKINPGLTLGKECIITGVAILSSSEADVMKMHNAMEDGMKEGWINPCVNKTFPLAKASQAHEEIAHNKGALGKIILRT